MVDSFQDYRIKNGDETTSSINESRFLGKVFSLAQWGKHRNYSNRLSQSVSNLKQIASSIRSAENERDFYKLMSAFVDQIADVVKAQSGQSSANITTGVASSVLAQNYRKDLNKIKSKLRIR